MLPSYFHFESSFDIYLSVIVSLLLLLGNYVTGKILFAEILDGMVDNKKFRFFHYPLLGNIIMNAMIQIGIACTASISILSYIVGITTLILGLYGLYMASVFIRRKNYFKFSKFKFDLPHIFILLLIGFFFLALAPITNADALDYHIGLPIWLLKQNHVTWQPTWFHQGLAGIGENSILVSLILNAEQYGTLIQFTGLFSIMGLFFCFNPLNRSIDNTYRFFFSILILSTPVLLFLGSTPKPQLTGIALTSLIYCIFINRKSTFYQLEFKKTTAIIFLLAYAVLLKLNFAFAAIILFFAILREGFRKKEFIKSNLTILIRSMMISFILLVLPVVIIRSPVWGNDFSHYFHPIPSSYPGFNSFMSYLSNYQDNPLPFPITIILPKTFGQMSMILGANIILLSSIFFIGDYRNKKQLLLVGILCLCISIFSQRSARFFFEPMVWLCLYFYTHIHSIPKYEPILRRLTIALGILQMLFLTFAVTTLTKGILNVTYRKDVMSTSANGYALSEWVNNILPAESHILLSHRSTALFNQHVYKSEWLKYIGKNKNDKMFYESYLIKQRIDYVVLTGNDPDQSPLFPYCNKLIAGPFEFNRETRNPANNSLPTKAWIYSSNLH